MLKLLMKIPRKIYVAVSGGADSMAALDFLKNNHDVTVLHFNHGTGFGIAAETFLKYYLEKNGIPVIFGQIKSDIPKSVSKEAFWRDERYAFFKEAAGDEPVVLAHNLDDAVETWLFSSIHGKPDIIPPVRENYIRPFLRSKKAELLDWCIRNEVPYLKDPCNDDLNHPRVRLRHIIIPEILKINPGIYKVVEKKYLGG